MRRCLLYIYICAYAKYVSVSLLYSPDALNSPSFTGTQGISIDLLTNFFAMSQDTDTELYQYHVYFSPEVDNKKTRKRLLNEHKHIVGEVKAFDGMVLFTSIKLDKDVGVALNFTALAA